MFSAFRRKSDSPDEATVQVGRGNKAAATTTTTTTPFCFDQDGYAYPNLFQEADEMTVVALLLYIMTDMRALAKTDQLAHGPERILTLPTTLEATLTCIEENVELLKAKTDHEMALEALKSIQQRFDLHQQEAASNSTKSWFNPFGAAAKATGTAPAQLVAFGDDQADKELVYAIAVDPVRKRITVGFRGSVTPVDFITDACIELHNRPNPVKGEGQDEKIGIHHGFDEYLLKRRKSEDCKYDEILRQVEALFDENDRYKDYKLYVTGHSLGGALACLFSFETAAAALTAGKDSKIPLPLTCVSVASPRVGNEAFQIAFGALEKQGALRHLRVAHAQDPVTMMPKTSSARMLAMLSPVTFLAVHAKDRLFASRDTYRHTGVKLRLLSDKKANKDKGPWCELSYASATTAQEELADDEPDSKKGNSSGSLLESIKALSFSGVPGVSFHYGPTYTERLTKVKTELSDMTLNGVYRSMAGK